MFKLKPIIFTATISFIGLGAASCASTGYGMSKTDSMESSAEAMDAKPVEMESMESDVSDAQIMVEEPVMNDVVMDSDTAMDMPEPQTAPEIVVEEIAPAPVTPVEPVNCPEGSEPQPNGTCMLIE